MKVGDFDIEVTSSQADGGWTASAILPGGAKVASGPSKSEEDARHDVFVQAQARLYPQQKVEFTKKFESMTKEQAILKHQADGLLEVIGREWVPPHQNLDDDTEIEMAAKQPFTAWEYAQRTNRHHPKLLKAVFNSPYEKLYKRQFNMKQFDPFYESKWLKGAVNPEHEGYCTPMTKKTCTPRRKALARRFKSGDLHQESIQEEADQLLEAPPGMVEAEQVSVPYVNKAGKQQMVPWIRRQRPRAAAGAAPHRLGEANFASSDERRALRRRMPRKKAAFYPSDGGGAGGGGGITSAV